MAPKIDREAIVVVLDVGASSSHLDTDGVSYFEKAKMCLQRIIQRKILSSSRDEIGIILLGSEETNNILACDDFADRYENINVLSKHLSMATWNMVREVVKVYGTEVSNGDWLEAIVVAMDFLKHSMEGKVFSESKIIILSKCKTDIKSDENISVIINTIKKMNTNLVVIGPDAHSEDNCSQKKQLISQIVTDTAGVICSYDDALTQLKFHIEKPKKPVAWNVCLTIGPDIKIPVVGYKQIDGAINFRWKKQSVDGAPVCSERVFCKQDDTIESEDVISGFLYGSTIIPFSEVEKQTMSYDSGDKSLTVFGFTHMSNLPKHIFIGDTVYYFKSRKNDHHAAVAFTALVKALLSLEMAIIARKVYRKGSVPMMGAMIPKIADTHCALLFLELPYAEDAKPLILPSLSKVKPTQEQYDCMYKLVTAMDLTDPEYFEEEPYTSDNLVNPFKEHVNNCIVLKALNQNIPNEPDKNIQDLLKPLPIIVERSKDILEEVKKLFPLGVQGVKKNKTAAAVFDVNRKVANVPVTDVKTEVDMDLDMADLMKSSVLEISTVNPDSEFLAVVKSGIPFADACKQLQSVIARLFISQTGGKKQLSALATLRKKCVEESPEIYNSWLGSFKDIIVERGDEKYWNTIIQEHLGLITKMENEQSNITLEDTKLFNEIKKQEVETNGCDEAMDADELLNMI